MILKRRELLMGLGVVALAPGATALAGTGTAAAADASDAALLRAAVAAVPGTREVITVAAPSMRSTDAEVSAWALLDGGWSKVFGPVPAKVGSLGIGEAADEVPRTPFGVFRLDQAFGRQDNPGTTMPYTKVTGRSWWGGDPASPATFDRMVTGANPGPGSENLYNAGPVYDYAVHFDNNPAHTPGRGAAFFLHVTDGNPTQGCVAVDRESMITLLRWLAPGNTPVLVTGQAQH